MESIEIIQNEIIAHHTRNNPASSYGQEVWVVEVEEPELGPAIWRQNSQEVEIILHGVVGGWLVVTQPDGFLSAIIWSDGNYYANIIEDRRKGNGVKNKSLEELKSGEYQVRGAIAVDAWDEESPLGSILI